MDATSDTLVLSEDDSTTTLSIQRQREHDELSASTIPTHSINLTTSTTEGPTTPLPADIVPTAQHAEGKEISVSVSSSAVGASSSTVVDIASIQLFRSATKVMPQAAFGRRTTGVGASAAARQTPLATASSGIRVLGIYCAKDYFARHGHAMSRHASSSPNNSPHESTTTSSSSRTMTPTTLPYTASSSSSLLSRKRGRAEDAANQKLTVRQEDQKIAFPTTSDGESIPSHPEVLAAAETKPTAPQVVDISCADVTLQSSSTELIAATTSGTIGMDGVPTTTASPTTSSATQWRTDAMGGCRVYVRILVDKMVELNLPLEVMRERHPRVLIDYLLSTAAFV